MWTHRFAPSRLEMTLFDHPAKSITITRQLREHSQQFQYDMTQFRAHDQRSCAILVYHHSASDEDRGGEGRFVCSLRTAIRFCVLGDRGKGVQLIRLILFVVALTLFLLRCDVFGIIKTVRQTGVSLQFSSLDSVFVLIQLKSRQAIVS
jgi:hypothetical protein